jgi:predicted alpha/beta superfamily hydrolase
MPDTTTTADAAANLDVSVDVSANRRADTVVRVVYPAERGPMFLRGSGAGLSWFENRVPDHVDGDVSTFRLTVPHFGPVQVKPVRHDGAWMVGRNSVIGHGDAVVLRPAFDRTGGDLSGQRYVPVPDGPTLCFRVRVPPSYGEQVSQRYPVLYTQDGQSVWSDGTDPFGTWGLDHVIDELWDVGALDEIIVISIDTGEDRLNKLGPIKDPHHGGGGAAEHLRAMVDVLKPLIDAEFRTRPDRQSTVLLGSSMGGLFSLWSAWTRPDVFGGAICLSPSLWWGERFMVKTVSANTCPAPRPNLYLDSGAAASGFEEDASTRDGVHNTRAMYRALREHCYGDADDLYLLSWTGHHHDARSWAARVSTPLQIFFPRST